MNAPRPVKLHPMRKPLPFGDADGALIPHAGRYARECVLVAFEMIGGVERLADWADKNPTEFYTKLMGKVITKEVEVHSSGGVEELLAQLDAPQDDAPVVEEPDYEIVE